MKLAVPHHAGITLHPHVAFDVPNKPADFKLTSLNQPVNHSACAASAKATAHPHISPSHLFFFLLLLAFSVRCLGHFMSAHLSFPFIPHPIISHPISSSPHSSLLSPSSLIPPHPAPSHPKEPPHPPPSRPCAQSFITARPIQLSHTPSFKKRHPTCRALPSSHVSSPHFSRPINMPRFLLDPRASPSACWRIY